MLGLSKGLLRALNARYAAFSFTRDIVVLDVFPVWSKGISRFVGRRSRGKKPAEDLKTLILDSGKEWHRIVGNKRSRSYATLTLLNKNHKEELSPENIKPSRDARPRLTKYEAKSLKVLKLKRRDLVRDTCRGRIRSAYKQMAKSVHPDVGGDTEKFKEINEAHEKLMSWAENPQFTSRRALADCWSYDGMTNRWSPPL